MKLIPGEQYLIGSKHAKEEYYDDIVGEVLTCAPHSRQTGSPCLYKSDEYGAIIEHWYIHQEDLTPYEVKTNERGLLFLHKEEDI
jgi:hypothetical protein